MRLRNLLTATAVSALSGALAVGALGAPAHATTPPSPAGAGSIVTWGDETNANAGPAIPVPGDLAGPVKAVAASQSATGVVTLDGAVRVWGLSTGAEVVEAPAPGDITDATAITFTSGNGAVLHADGQVTAWGSSSALADVPSDLRAKAIAIQPGFGYAVRTDGTLATWGETPGLPLPETGLTDLVDVTASLTHVLALHADGTVTSWGFDLDGLHTPPDFGGKKVVKIAAGFGYSGAVLEDGSLVFWGPYAPTEAPTLDGQTPSGKVVSLSLGFTFGSTVGAAVTADGAVHAWGSDVVEDVPASLTGQPVSAVAVDDKHAAAIVTTFRNLTKPTVAGTPAVGQTLTATPATFSLAPDAPATGQWYAGADPIAGKTATTLTLEAAQLGEQISYRSTATRGEDTITSTSDATAAVTPALSTTTLSVAPATGAVGTARTVTATVAKAGGTPTGTVTFTTGTTTGTATLAAGKASWTLPSNLTAGTHQVSASYAGDSNTNASTATPLMVTVTKADATVTLSVAPATGAAGTARTVTATVASTGGTPTGTVTFTTGTTTGTATLAAGKATWTLPGNLTAGTHQVSANYAGDSTTNPSAAAPLTVTVTKAGAKVTVKAKSKGKTKKVAKKTTLTITVKAPKGVSAAGKVTVTLKGKTKKTARAKVNARGKATITIKNLKHGKYKAIVKYAGNASVKDAGTRASFKA